MKFAIATLVLVVLELALSNPVLYPKGLTAEQVQHLEEWPLKNQRMWQASGQFEGDMVLTPEQEAALKSRNGLVDTRYRWSNREIPYEMSGDFTASERQFIEESLAKEYAKTCITVRPRRSSDTDYVYITGKNTGCWSYVGRLGSRQELNLQRNGCIWYGTIAHEMLHAAGFYHQQSATERDDWVDIMWQNIQEGHEHNFNKYGSDMITSFGEKYDYGSIMHYDKYAFSKNGQPTIVPKDPNAQIGQSNGLSAIDIAKLNKMYGCA